MTPITERQQYWLDQIQSADAFDGTLVEYVRNEGLKVKDLYQWKTLLTRRDFIASKSKPKAFIPVQKTANSAQAVLVLPNGVRIELTGCIDAGTVKALAAAASDLG
jgi:hypothetical protein